MCRLRTYLSLSAAKTSQNLPNDGATPTLRNGRVQLLSAHLDCFNGPRPATTSHKWPRKQRKVGLWSCLRAVRSDSPVLEGRPTVLHNIDHSKTMSSYSNALTLWGWVAHICVSKLSQHWFKQRHVAWSAPSYYLNQCWHVVDLTPRISFAKWRQFCLRHNVLN